MFMLKIIFTIIFYFTFYQFFSLNLRLYKNIYISLQWFVYMYSIGFYISYYNYVFFFLPTMFFLTLQKINKTKWDLSAWKLMFVWAMRECKKSRNNNNVQLFIHFLILICMFFYVRDFVYIYSAHNIRFVSFQWLLNIFMYSDDPSAVKVDAYFV